MNNEFKLSICMMIKDEEKNLKRCLDALKPLLEKPDVELIIVDTGSTDSSVEIASGYTSKLYLHKWGNNFSEMRNITISYAKGNFIFILDADEVLLDAAQLYEILTDEKNSGFNTLLLKIKNLLGYNGIYTLLPQERVFRNDGEFRYEGSVHNQPIIKEPVLSTDIYIEHYGYMFKDQELKEKKFNRTCTMLKEALEKNPDSLYYRFQIARSYDAHGDIQDALREIRIAYELSLKEKQQRPFLFGSYATICVKNCEFEEAILVCKRGLDLKYDYIDLYYLMAESYSKLGLHKEALEAYISYIDYCERYNDLPVSANRTIELYCMNDFFNDAAVTYIINEFLRQCRYDEAKAYADKLIDKKTKNNFLFSIYLKLREFGALKELFYASLDDRETGVRFSIQIEEEKLRLNAGGRLGLEKLFSEGEDSYSMLNRIRLAEGDEKELLIDQFLKDANLNDLPDFYSDIFLDAVNNPRLIYSCLKRLKKTTVKKYVNRLIEKDSGFKSLFETFLLEERIRENDFDSLKLYISVSYVLLYRMAGTVENDIKNIPEQYHTIFDRYVRYGLYYVSMLYNGERLRLHYNTLNDMEDIFLISLKYAKEAINKGDFITGIKYFRESVRSNQYMSCYMKKYMQELFPDETKLE